MSETEASSSPAFILVDDFHLRIDEISSIKMDRGYSFTNLIITMRNGTSFQHRDSNGSAYRVQELILKAAGE